MGLEEVSFLEDVQFASNEHMLSSFPSSLPDIPSRKQKIQVTIRGQKGKKQIAERTYSGTFQVTYISYSHCLFLTNTLLFQLKNPQAKYTRWRRIKSTNPVETLIIQMNQWLSWTCRKGLGIIQEFSWHKWMPLENFTWLSTSNKTIKPPHINPSLFFLFWLAAYINSNIVANPDSGTERSNTKLL